MALSKIDPAGLDIGQIGGRRNLIINGAMQVAQRGTSATGVTTPAYYSVDRMKFDIGSCGTHTVSQAADAPDGFATSYKIEVTTAEATPTTTDKLAMQYLFEGQDLQQLKYGTTSAQDIALSFWVKTNKTGTYSNEVIQTDNSNRHYSFSYTVNSADTWEYKTLVISGDSIGLIDNDTGLGLVLKFWLDGGDSWTSGTYTANQWQARTNANVISSSSPHLADTIGNYWQITGVQLEVGTVATPFEHRSYGEELALCQRYYQIIQEGAGSRDNSGSITVPGEYLIGVGFAYQSTRVMGHYRYIVPMRAIPTGAVSASSDIYCLATGGAWSAASAVNLRLNDRSARLDINGVSLTAGHATEIQINANTDGYLEFDAEL